MGESTSRWAGMAPPEDIGAPPHAGARSHWRAVLSTGQCGQGQPLTGGRQVTKSEPSLQLANVVPATRSLQPQRETDTNQITSPKKIRGQLVHEGEVGEAIRTCDLGFSQEAGVGSALCGRSRCVKGPGRASVWRAEHQGKAQGRPRRRS